MNDSTQNPYEAPQSTETIPEAQWLMTDDDIQIRPVRIVFKWLAVCGLSAAPSFVWGLMLSSQSMPQILGMLAGILVFVGAYSMAECTVKVQRFLNRPHVRLTARIGYGTRLLLTIFLVGAYLDLFIGIFAVGLSGFFLGDAIPSENYTHGPATAFFAYMFTTIIQGIMLNIILGAYMLIVYLICRAVGSK